VLLLEPNPLTQRVIAKTVRDSVGEVEAVADAEALLAALAAAPRAHLILQAAAARDRLGEMMEAAGDARILLLFAPEDGVNEAALAKAGLLLLRKPVAGETLLAAMRGESPAVAA